jgi:hypothetical protein
MTLAPGPRTANELDVEEFCRLVRWTSTDISKEMSASSSGFQSKPSKNQNETSSKQSGLACCISEVGLLLWKHRCLDFEATLLFVHPGM